MLPLAIGLFVLPALKRLILKAPELGPGTCCVWLKPLVLAVPRAASGVLVFPGCNCQWPGSGYGRTESGCGRNGPGTLAWKFSFLE